MTGPDETLAGVATRALTVPRTVSAVDVAAAIDALAADGERRDSDRLALAALAAIAYARPDLVDDALVERLGALAASGAGGDHAWMFRRLLEWLAGSEAALRMWPRLHATLRDVTIDARIRERLLPVVAVVGRWHDDLVDLDAVLGLAEGLPSPSSRSQLLMEVERLVFSTPERFTPERLERIVALFGDRPRWRYTLRFLAARHALAPDVRELLTTRLVGQFPLAATARAVLGASPLRLLVMVNINLGQGDEIVRVVPLVQALLDLNPALTVTIVARRAYLYDCPRVTTVPIRDAAAVAAALAEPFAALVEIFQPDEPAFAPRFSLHEAVDRRVARQRMALVIRAELGRAQKGDLAVRSEFLYQSVVLDGTDVAHARGLDQPTERHHNYDPCLRLLAELDLPQRVGEEQPRSPSILVGTPSLDAERAWRDLLAGAEGGRPVALVNPFGGAWASKGFHEQDALLAGEIGGLVDEGFTVVVLPNGTPWGRRATVRSALAHLDPDTLARVRVAPDPAEADPGMRVDLPERADLAYADRVMRLFKYFAASADLVVTVEGWMAHLAWSLGRPLRLFLAAGAFTPDWYPLGRSRAQRLATTLSIRPRVPHETTALLDEGDPPALPHLARRSLLQVALHGLGWSGRTEDERVARHALTSSDTDVREWAVGVLGRVVAARRGRDDDAAGAARELLIAALQDSAPHVGRDAAEALLRGDADCSRELGPRYRDVLRAQANIVRQNWEHVRQIGPAAFPPLFRAATQGSMIVAHGARALLREMLGPFVATLPPERPTARARESPRPRLAPCEAVVHLLRSALVDPACLDAVDVEAAAEALRLDPDDPELCDVAVAAVAALLYARPELADAALVDRLADLLTSPSPPASVPGHVTTLFEVLATGPLAAHAWARLEPVLRDERLEARTRERLLSAAREMVEWREDLVGLDGVLALAEAPSLAAHRDFLLDHGVERFVFCAPEAFTPSRLERVAARFREASRYRHVLAWLAARPGLPAESRALVARELDGRFPFQAAAAEILHNRPLTLLVVLNVGQGQGDDMVRLAPLLQGLLDANPALAITLVTWRTYLYDSPRITTVRIHDDDAVQAALAAGPEGVIEFFQPEALDFTFRLETHGFVEAHLKERRPAFLVTGDLGRVCEGRVGGRSPFLHQVVRLGDEDIAARCALDAKLVPSIYDPGMRLLAELGLPLRAGEERPATPGVLTGVPSADAERAWAALVARDPADAGRPVALVNPFGGSGITKGFSGQDAVLAAEIVGLVAEGSLVVLLPNGQTWGRRRAFDGVLARLDPEMRAHVRVAPDPAEDDEAARLDLPERDSLSYADRVMRMFKYFATYADLVVTVEGWLSHLAYLLGRPFRLFLAGGSFGSDWYPRGRSPRQRFVTTLSAEAHDAYAWSALLREGDPPPLPHRPRKHLLELALPALARAGVEGALAPLRLAMASPDPDVRTWAAMGLGRLVPAEAAKADLVAALKDRFAAVGREAADALLRAGVDCTRELGPRYRDRLQVELDIARQNWDAVAQAGPAALPALFRAAEGDLHDVRAGAKQLLRGALAPFVPRLRPPDAPASTS